MKSFKQYREERMGQQSRWPIAKIENFTDLPFVIEIQACPHCGQKHTTKLGKYFNGSSMTCPRRPDAPIMKFYEED